MIPDIAWVVRKRFHVRRRMLHMSLILFILAAMPVGGFLVDITTAMTNGSDFELYMFVSSLRIFCMFALPGTLIWLFHASLVKWLVPLPKAACPKCSYALQSLTNSRCPECGLKLPEGLVAQPESD